MFETALYNLTRNCNLRCTHCLDGNSLILTQEGFKKIKDIQIGEKVLSHKGDMQKVINIFKHENSEPLIQIKPCNLSPINLTKNHKIFIKNNGGIIKKEAECITKEDYLVIPKIKFKNLSELDLFEVLPKELNSFKSPFNKVNQQKYEYLLNNLSVKSEVLGDKLGLHPTYVRKLKGLIKKNSLRRSQFKKVILTKTKTRIRYTNMKKSIPRFITHLDGFSKLLGYYTAEGCCIKDKNRVNSYCLKLTFSKKETEYINEVTNLFTSLFNVEPVIEEDKKCNVIKVAIYNSTLSLLFKELCGSHSNKKHVPNFILQSNPSIIFNYLRGLFNGDGSIFIAKKNEYLNLTTVSEQLSKEVVFLLLQLGYRCSLQSRMSKSHIYHGRLIKPNYPVWTILISYNKVNDFLNKKLNPKYVSKFHNHMLRNIQFTKKHIYVRVDKICKMEGIEKVYNLEVAKDHSYLCDSISVGNCSVAAGIPFNNELTTDQVANSFERLKEMGVQTLILMGGEPFMKLRVMDLIEYASKLFKHVHVETNGMVCPINFVDFIKGRGIDNLTIFVSVESSDSDYNDALRGSGNLEQSIVFIKKLKQSKIPVAIRSTLFSDNDYKGVISLAKGLGVNVIFVRFLQQGRGKELDLMPNKERLKEVYEEIMTKGNAQISDCPYYIYDAQLLNKVKDSFAKDGAICQVLKKSRVIIDADGTVYPCVMLLENKYKLGNILKDDKEKIEKKYDELLVKHKKLKISEGCDGCRYFNLCGGGCYWLHDKEIGDPSCPINDKIKTEVKMEESSECEECKAEEKQEEEQTEENE